MLSLLSKAEHGSHKNYNKKSTGPQRKHAQLGRTSQTKNNRQKILAAINNSENLSIKHNAAKGTMSLFHLRIEQCFLSVSE